MDSSHSHVLTPNLCEVCMTGWEDVDSLESIRIPFCVSVKILCTKGRDGTLKQRRTEKRDELLKLVAALRNSGGGDLIVHFQGLHAKDRNLCYFHESFDEQLNILIEDGKPFADVYRKTWYLDEYEEEDPLSEYLILTVAPSNSISTADFKTKIALDSSILRPSASNLKFTVLNKNRAHQSLQPKLLLEDDLEKHIEESRCIQFKRVSLDFEDMDLAEKTEYVWTKLRLREYITSFSKLPEGGSFFIGISENTKSNLEGFQEIEIIKEGIALEIGDCEEFKELIDGEIRNSLLMFTLESEDKEAPLVKTEFYPISGTNCIVEIAVRPMHGCIFYDTEGPETYYIQNGNTIRVPFDLWLKKIESLRL